MPLLKDAGPSQELCKQLKVAKDRVYAACDASISWMKEDVTRIWLEVDAYVMVGYIKRRLRSFGSDSPPQENLINCAQFIKQR